MGKKRNKRLRNIVVDEVSYKWLNQFGLLKIWRSKNDLLFEGYLDKKAHTVNERTVAYSKADNLDYYEPETITPALVEEKIRELTS